MRDAPDNAPTLPDPPDPFAAGSGFSLGFLDTPGNAAPAAPEAPPSGLGGSYVLKSLIGVGGQGEVWEAWQNSLGRVVAVKVHKSGDRERFVREAMLTGALDHPAIVPVLDFGSLARGDAGAPATAMAMKRVRGTRWDELIARERPGSGPPDTAFLARHLGVLETVCQAVAYAHSRGVLHLDLKPGQVLVGEYGEVYLCDWGMAARVPAGGGAPEFLSPPSGPFGTPGFMAPEQALGDVEAVGIATDVYLLGGLLAFLLAGEAPHPGRSAGEAVAAARRNECVALSSAIPAVLRGVVARALATRPGDRFASAEEFRAAATDALRRATREEEAAALCESAARRLREAAALDYAELNALEQQVDRAAALAPDAPGAARLRDDTLERHALQAVGGGDLALARVVCDRMTDPSRRQLVAQRVAAACRAAEARERQRVRARRIALGAMGALVVVLVAASLSLYQAFGRAAREQARAEDALAESRRELARASLQAALSYLENERPADAREALRRVPADHRGWEWGMLASWATPEEHLLLPRDGHYQAMALSGDGAHLAAIRSGDRALILVDRRAGGARLVLADRAWTAVSSGPGDMVLAGTSAGEIVLVPGNGTRVPYPCGDSPIRHLAAGSNGAVFAADDSGALWRLLPGGVPERLWSTEARITVLSASDCGVAVGTRDGSVWHGPDGDRLVRTTERHTAPVEGIAWHPVREQFVTWAVEPGVQQPSSDSRAIIHDVGREQPARVTITVEEGLTAAAWSPDGALLGLAFANTWLHELETETWTLARSNHHGVGIARALHYRDDGATLVIVSRQMVQVRATQWFEQRRVFRLDSRGVAGHALAGDRLVACGTDGGVGEWSLAGPAHRRTETLAPDRATHLDGPSDTGLLAAAHQWGWAVVRDARQNPPARVGQTWSEEPVARVRISGDGETLVLASTGTRIEIHRRANDSYGLAGVRLLDSPVTAVALHPSGDWLAVATADGRLRRVALDEAEGNPGQPAEPGEVRTLEFTSDGTVLLAGLADGAVLLLDPVSLAVRRRLEGHAAAVTQLSPPTDGAVVVSASEDETARAWSVATGEALGVYRGTHAGSVVRAMATPDGRRVLTACGDSFLRVFDLESGAELVALPAHEYGVRDMAPAPDGRTIITAGQDGRLSAWTPLAWDAGDDVLTTGRAR